jgi:CBS domain-containing protein
MDPVNEAEQRSQWACQNRDSSSASCWLFEEGLPVRLIATPRADFKTCHADESLADVLERNREGFDYFPVTETGGGTRIVGLVDLTSFHQGEQPDGHVRDKVTRLTEANLIGADAGIITFVKNADQHGCRLVVAGAEISGLVTLSDLQKLPVQAALFGMITHLEIVMANLSHPLISKVSMPANKTIWQGTGSF